MKERLLTDGNNKVWIGKATVRKHIPENFQAEIVKHGVLREIALQGSFCVPTILNSDSDSKIIEFERIPNAVTGKDLFIESCGLLSSSLAPASFDLSLGFFEKCGQALAEIHSYTGSSKGDPWRASEALESTFNYFLPLSVIADLREHVLLHGDFGFANTLYNKKNINKIFIIDPSPNYYILDKCDVTGHRLIDVAKMSLCLRGTVPLKKAIMLRHSKAKKLRLAFIEAYEKASGQYINPDLLLRFEMSVFAAKMKYSNKGSLRSLAMAVFLFGPIDGIKAWNGSHAQK